MFRIIDHETSMQMLPIYALDALEVDETIEIELHLAECEMCRSELLVLRESITDGLGADIAPPSWIHDTIISEAERDTNQIDHRAGDSNFDTSPPTTAGRTTSKQRRILAVAAAVVTVSGWAVAASGYYGSRPGAVAAILASPARVTIKLTSTNGKSFMTLVEADGSAAITSTNLSKTAKNMSYQLWGVSGGKMISLSVMGGSPTGSVFSYSDPTRYQTLAVTVEPATGSPQPTSTPVVEYTRPN